MKVRTDKAARIAAALIAAVAVGAPALAHHAFQAEFDGNQPIMLQGKVTKVEWINPHTWVHMIVVTDGTPQEWMVEAGTPNTLLREGLTRDSLKPGEQIIVRAIRPIFAAQNIRVRRRWRRLRGRHCRKAECYADSGDE